MPGFVQKTPSNKKPTAQVVENNNKIVLDHADHRVSSNRNNDNKIKLPQSQLFSPSSSSGFHAIISSPSSCDDDDDDDDPAAAAASAAENIGYGDETFKSSETCYEGSTTMSNIEALEASQSQTPLKLNIFPSSQRKVSAGRRALEADVEETAGDEAEVDFGGKDLENDEMEGTEKEMMVNGKEHEIQEEAEQDLFMFCSQGLISAVLARDSGQVFALCDRLKSLLPPHHHQLASIMSSCIATACSISSCMRFSSFVSLTVKAQRNISSVLTDYVAAIVVQLVEYENSAISLDLRDNITGDVEFVLKHISNYGCELDTQLKCNLEVVIGILEAFCEGCFDFASVAAVATTSSNVTVEMRSPISEDLMTPETPNRLHDNNNNTNNSNNESGGGVGGRLPLSPVNIATAAVTAALASRGNGIGRSLGGSNNGSITNSTTNTSNNNNNNSNNSNNSNSLHRQLLRPKFGNVTTINTVSSSAAAAASNHINLNSNNNYFSSSSSSPPCIIVSPVLPLISRARNVIKPAWAADVLTVREFLSSSLHSHIWVRILQDYVASLCSTDHHVMLTVAEVLATICRESDSSSTRLLALGARRLEDVDRLHPCSLLGLVAASPEGAAKFAAKTVQEVILSAPDDVIDHVITLLSTSPCLEEAALWSETVDHALLELCQVMVSHSLQTAQGCFEGGDYSAAISWLERAVTVPRSSVGDPRRNPCTWEWVERGLRESAGKFRQMGEYTGAMRSEGTALLFSVMGMRVGSEFLKNRGHLSTDAVGDAVGEMLGTWPLLKSSSSIKEPIELIISDVANARDHGDNRGGWATLLLERLLAHCTVPHVLNLVLSSLQRVSESSNLGHSGGPTGSSPSPLPTSVPSSSSSSSSSQQQQQQQHHHHHHNHNHHPQAPLYSWHQQLKKMCPFELAVSETYADSHLDSSTTTSDSTASLADDRHVSAVTCLHGVLSTLSLPIMRLYDSRGNFIKEPSAGNLGRINNVIVKDYPEFPLVEVSVNSLQLLLFGRGATPCELVKVKLPYETKPRAVLLSRAAGSANLGDVIINEETAAAHSSASNTVTPIAPTATATATTCTTATASTSPSSSPITTTAAPGPSSSSAASAASSSLPFICPSIEPESFSEQVITALLITPSDIDCHNYMVDRVVCRDGTKALQLTMTNVDRAFVEPIAPLSGLQRFWKDRTIQLRCILFCSDQMQDHVPPKIVESFARLNVQRFVENWVCVMASAASRCKQLFTDQEREEHLHGLLCGSSGVASRRSVLFSTLTVDRFLGIIRALEKLQTLCKAASLGNRASLTNMDLFKCVWPEIAAEYEAVLGTKMSLIARLNKVTEVNGADKGKQSPAEVLQSMLGLQGTSSSVMDLGLPELDFLIQCVQTEAVIIGEQSRAVWETQNALAQNNARPLIRLLRECVVQDNHEGGGSGGGGGGSGSGVGSSGVVVGTGGVGSSGVLITSPGMIGSTLSPSVMVSPGVVGGGVGSGVYHLHQNGGVSRSLSPCRFPPRFSGIEVLRLHQHREAVLSSLNMLHYNQIGDENLQTSVLDLILQQQSEQKTLRLQHCTALTDKKITEILGCLGNSVNSLCVRGCTALSAKGLFKVLSSANAKNLVSLDVGFTSLRTFTAPHNLSNLRTVSLRGCFNLKEINLADSAIHLVDVTGVYPVSVTLSGIRVRTHFRGWCGRALQRITTPMGSIISIPRQPRRGCPGKAIDVIEADVLYPTLGVAYLDRQLTESDNFDGILAELVLEFPQNDEEVAWFENEWGGLWMGGSDGNTI